MTSSRSAEKVFQDHLRLGREGSAEENVLRNCAEDVVILTASGVHRGHEGLSALAQRLRDELPDAETEYRTTLIDGEVGFLEWTARSGSARVDDGADSFLIRDDRIVAQTIHYTVVHGSG